MSHFKDDEVRVGKDALVRLLLLIFVCALLPGPQQADAESVTNDRPLLFSFDGHDTTTGRFTTAGLARVGNSAFYAINALAVDYSNGDVYVIDGGHEAVDKFNSTGGAQSFTAGPAANKSSLLGPSVSEPFKVQNPYFFGLFPDLAIDNSNGKGGASEGEQGRLYVSGDGGTVDAFNKEGEFLWSLPAAGVCGIAVDNEGHLWIGDGSNDKVLEFDTTGTGFPSATPIREIEVTTGNETPCRLGVDRSGANLYVALRWNLVSPGPPELNKYTDGTFATDFTTTPTRAITVDQAEAGGHIFAATDNAYGDEESKLREFEATGAEVPGSPFGRDLIGDLRGVAYEPGKNWVYLSDASSESVKVFGPRASSTVPDVAIGKTAEVARHTAKASGTINPQGVLATYHFEWVKGGNEVQHLAFGATGGTYRICTGGESPQCTEPIPYNAQASEIQAALEVEGLTQVGPGNVVVTGHPPNGAEHIRASFDFTFVSALAGMNVPQMSIDKSGLNGLFESIEFTTSAHGPIWADAESLAPQSIEPSDENSHGVSLAIGGLSSNTTYSVRLVGTNSESGLDEYSRPDIFTTLPPPSPLVEDCEIPPSEITKISAHLTCKLDTQEDKTTWQVLRSAQPDASKAECEALDNSEFTKVGEDAISAGETGKIPISADLSGLQPAETNCVRVIATNGNPVRGVANLVFITEAIPPSELETVFTAPRTDTMARINGRLNPEGDATLTYRFELSEDGTTWTPVEGCKNEEGKPTADCVSTANGREKIVVGEELRNLKPETTYHYRLASAKNIAGAASAPLSGEERTFTTQSTAEVQSSRPCPNEGVRRRQHSDAYLGFCRGIELINSADKGDQNALPRAGSALGSAMRQDGEEALWTVKGGAPGGHTASGDTFLARRTGPTEAAPSGWESKTLIPPAAQQLGQGVFAYVLKGSTADFSHFIFRTGTPNPLSFAEPGPFVRIGTDQREEVLLSNLFRENQPESYPDLTEDGAHVIAIDPDSGQLEDVGDPSRPPEVVSLMPSGARSSCQVDHEVGFNAGPQKQAGYRWMASDDASRVYFEVRRGGECGEREGEAKGLLGLYVHNRETGKTTLIDPGSGPTFGGAGNVEMIRATPDGKVAYFITYSHCRRWNQMNYSCVETETKDTNSGLDVYRWDETSGKSSCLTCAVADAGLATTGFTAVQVLVSDDFSHLYFQSEKQLVTGQGKAGTLNLYVLSGGKLRFVADPYVRVLGGNKARLSAGGDVLLFGAEMMREQGLTADAITKRCPSITPGGGTGRCEELYRYDDRDSSLECLSCFRGGETSQSYGTSATEAGFFGQFGLSSDGTTAIFPTAQPLVPGDVNRGTDLYEWRNGAVNLITDGASSFQRGQAAPEFAGVSADGSDVMFSLVSPGLTGFEHDGLVNLYDARINGGFVPPGTPEHCSEESCQGSLQPAPPIDHPGSAGYEGPNNETSPKPHCARSRVRRRGRCVKRRRHRYADKLRRRR